MTVGAVLLAAGSGRRMGADKLMADLDGRPLILHAFDAILAAGLDGPIVATMPGGPIAALLEGRGRVVAVADHALGMGHSLAAAMRAVPADWTAAIICLADMPFVATATLKALVGAASPEAIVRPAFEGRPGNPVLWGRNHFPALASLTGDRGGRDLLARHPASSFPCNDPGVLIDIDTPEALAEARKSFGRE
ncbi:MAG: nucleotidyltransferase family protein [Pseudomonadota bacterium]